MTNRANSPKALVIYGTRPEAIKLGTIVAECRRRDLIQPIVCWTGQHRSLAQAVADYFELNPDIDLDLMKPQQSLAELTARCLTALEDQCRRVQPDVIVVQGDTTSAMAGGLVAFYRQLPLVHVEAGLRTGDLMAPWPEEMNRRIIALAATVHCAATRRAADNLLEEGVAAEKVCVTGNPVIDALYWTLERERHADCWRTKYAHLENRKIVLVTAHRRENFGGGIERVCQAIRLSARAHPQATFVFPVHLNPRVADEVRRTLHDVPNVHLLPPVDYPEFVWLMDRSHLILTDSGGIQEEAPALGKPVVVMRDCTERMEAVDAGYVRLVGTNTDEICQAVSCLLADSLGLPSVSPFGDGKSATRIVDLIEAAAHQQQLPQQNPDHRHNPSLTSLS